MNLQFIQGQFNATDAIDLITQMMHIRINHHENKIKNNTNEEDIKFWEIKIKGLQNDLVEIRKSIESGSGSISLKSVIEIE